MSSFAPVPIKQDTRADYDKRPFSDGPYKMESNSATEQVFVRNKFWDKGTDGVRKAYPDKIIITRPSGLTEAISESDVLPVMSEST